MTKKEYVNRNIGMTFDFIRQAVDNPEILNIVPKRCRTRFYR